MEDFLKLVTEASNVGIPLIISLGVLYLLWTIGRILPEAINKYVENVVKNDEAQRQENKERQCQCDEQLKMIITVAQQGVEAQRRGNEVIERNNIILEGKRKTEDNLAEAIKSLKDTTSRLDDSVTANTDVVRDTYTEIVRVGATVSK